jgi:hypothetical protein
MMEAAAVDMVFIMDVTGSMQKWIEQATKTVIDQATDISRRFGIMAKVRFAFVGYRDYSDTERTVLDFTPDLATFVEYVKAVKAESPGNYDICEDVFTGIERAGELLWTPKEHGCTKHIVHIGDAPCHGASYHGLDSRYDDYLAGELHMALI